MNRRANHILVRWSAEVRRVKYERPPRRGGQAAQTSIELKGGEGRSPETDTLPQPRGPCAHAPSDTERTVQAHMSTLLMGLESAPRLRWSPERVQTLSGSSVCVWKWSESLLSHQNPKICMAISSSSILTLRKRNIVSVVCNDGLGKVG